MDEGNQASDVRYLCTSSGTMITSTIRMLPLCRIIIGNLIVFPAHAGSDPGLEALFGQAQGDGQASKQTANASRKVIQILAWGIVYSYSWQHTMTLSCRRGIRSISWVEEFG
jgi:hypothetical protein